MSSKAAIGSVGRFLEQPLAQRGLSLWDIEFVKEGPDWFFRIYIDKDGGVQIDDCEFISRAAEGFLDETDPIPQAYMLEVCSPGLDRALKRDSDFLRYIGHMVDIKLFKGKDGRKKFQGELKSFADGVITITESTGDYSFDRAEVGSCKLTVIL
jgi:ribosome maturation factor RimP